MVGMKKESSLACHYILQGMQELGMLAEIKSQTDYLMEICEKL
jgi:hypothetical protein